MPQVIVTLPEIVLWWGYQKKVWNQNDGETVIILPGRQAVIYALLQPAKANTILPSPASPTYAGAKEKEPWLRQCLLDFRLPGISHAAQDFKQGEAKDKKFKLLL